jgi:hypothetical protein
MGLDTRSRTMQDRKDSVAGISIWRFSTKRKLKWDGVYPSHKSKNDDRDNGLFFQMRGRGWRAKGEMRKLEAPIAAAVQ